MPVHANSIECYHSLNLSERQAIVYGAFVGAIFLTDRQAKERLGEADMNAVRPRITEMVDSGVLVECGKMKDEVTGKTVRVCAIAEKP